MNINEIEISSFRNFDHIALPLGHRVNLFYGLNGSGKTSFLEALYYLGLGRSFRTRNLNRLFNNDHDAFSIISQISQPSGISLPIGIERKKALPGYLIKIAGREIQSLIELAELLPLQLINADSHLLLNSGPLIRRQYLDWGVFHVEPSFFHYWQRASRILKQRNAALKKLGDLKEITLWDDELVRTTEWLHNHRKKYVEQLISAFTELIALLLPETSCYLHYYPGWPRETPFSDALSASIERDKNQGYTHHGPHRADLQLKTKGVAATEVLSQGQQKLAAYALRLAQGCLLQKNSSKNCIFLIDDLPSELDAEKRTKISELINTIPAQFFITGIEPETLRELHTQSTRMFHVERGDITAI